MRCSAASSATRAADDAESAIVPPPPPSKVNAGSSPSAPASRSSSACSTSVPAGSGRPEHPLDAEAPAEQVAEQRGEGGVGREVAEEARVLPVQGRGDDDPVELVEQRVERLRPVGQQLAEGAADVARGDVRADRAVGQPGAVGGHPVDHRTAQPAELLRIEVAHRPASLRSVGSS